MGTREAMRAAAQTVAETAVEGAAGMGLGEAAASQDGLSGGIGTAGSARFFPWRFLGMGLLIAWLCCTHITAVFPGSGFDLEPRHTFDYAMRIGDVGMLLLLGVAAPRLGRLSRHRVLAAVLVGLTGLGTLAGGLALIPEAAPTAPLAVVGAVTALGGAVLFCLWAEIYSQMGMTRTIMYGAFSCLVAGGAAFLVCTMRPPYAILATAVLPGLSLGCAWLSLRALPGEPVRRPSTRYAVPWKLVAIMAVAGLLSGSSGLVLGGVEGVGAMFRVLATVLAAVVILAVMFVRRDRMDVRFLAKVALPLAVIALALLPFAHSAIAYLVAFLLKFAYVWFTFFVLLVLAGICYRYEVPSLRVFAIARASSEAAILFGIVLRRGLRRGGHRARGGLRARVGEREVRQRRLGRGRGGARDEPARGRPARAVHGPLRPRGRRRRAHGPGSRDHGPCRPGPHPPRDRTRAVLLREHREDPRPPPPREAGHVIEGRGHRPGRRAGGVGEARSGQQSEPSVAWEQPRVLL